MRIISLLFVAILAGACGSNADTDGDGTISGIELCDSTTTLSCQTIDLCGDLSLWGYESVEDCYEADISTCEYFAEHCEVDQEAARACVTEASVRSSTCEPDTGDWSINGLEECQLELFVSCEFG